MSRTFSMVLGAGISVALLIAALWAWQSALALGARAVRPEIAMWAFRSGAVALAAIGEMILLTFVVGRIYRRDSLSQFLRISAALVSGVGFVCAVALGLAAR